MLHQSLHVTLQEGAWWIIPHNPPMGPYDAIEDALDDLRGVKRFYAEAYPNLPEPTLEELFT